MTYLTPGIPITVYQMYQRYLEEALGCDTYLMVESRWSGPPADRMDPFTADDADIAFVCSTSYLRQLEVKNKFMELLPVAPIHNHPKNEERPIYYSEIIVHKTREDMFKEFHDLKGHTWAYNDEEFLSGNISVLAELKRHGLNASFFGHIVKSGSHETSLQWVLNSTVDAAAVDSNFLQYWMKNHPEDRKKVHVVHTIGPLPIQPLIVNTRMEASLKERITEALCQMNQNPKWQEELAQLSLWGFKPIDNSLYDKEKDIKAIVKDMKLYTAYY